MQQQQQQKSRKSATNSTSFKQNYNSEQNKIERKTQRHEGIKESNTFIERRIILQAVGGNWAQSASAVPNWCNTNFGILNLRHQNNSKYDKNI